MKKIKNNRTYSITILMLISASLIGCSESDVTVTYADGSTEKIRGNQIFGFTTYALIISCWKTRLI